MMVDGLHFALIFVSALGCGVVAGVFFAFSAFVMPALGRLSPAEGVAAMQSINVAAVSFAFMTALFGTAASCLGLVAWAVFSADGWAALFESLGGALYLVGTIGVTVARNVPLNDALAEAHPRSSGVEAIWHEYISKWTAWNHVRTLAALTAAAMLTIALHVNL